jgi:hypothetical protein
MSESTLPLKRRRWLAELWPVTFLSLGIVLSLGWAAFFGLAFGLFLPWTVVSGCLDFGARDYRAERNCWRECISVNRMPAIVRLYCESQSTTLKARKIQAAAAKTAPII